jgi:hypothetical protein
MESYDAEKDLLEAVAKAKGISVEQLLIDEGKLNPPAKEPEESVVVFSAPVAVELPAPAETAPKDDFVPVISDFAPPPPAAEEDKPKENQIEALAPICVHCGWDQRAPSVEPPSKQDKLTFLFTVLGQKLFTKDYSLLNDNLKLAFRSLTVSELDALYADAYREQQAGHIDTTQQYYEYLNRQRLFLQLQVINSQQTAMHITLPAGLDAASNPKAGKNWVDLLKEKDAYASDAPLIPQIQDYVLRNVLNSEHLQRIVSHYCAKFNQLVAKLEANIENENFWKETETQP